MKTTFQVFIKATEAIACQGANSAVSQSKMLHILNILLHKFQLL